MAQPLSIFIGDVFDTLHGKLEVIEVHNSQKVKVRFVNTGYETFARTQSIKKGTVKDYYAPLEVAGYLGGNKYTWKNSTHIYQAWRNMLRRCYDNKNDRYSCYGGAGVYVEDSWHNFQNFAEWWVKEEIKIGNCKTTLDLEKDFSYRGFYSEVSCKLVPHDLNMFLSVNIKRERPSVFYDKGHNHYRVKCFSSDGKTLLHSKCYATWKKAAKVWVRNRTERFEFLADKYQNIPYLESIILKGRYHMQRLKDKSEANTWDEMQ